MQRCARRRIGERVGLTANLHDAAGSLPLGTQRSPASRTGQSARAPETWALYLTDQVLPFWRDRGWLNRAAERSIALSVAQPITSAIVGRLAKRRWPVRR